MAIKFFPVNTGKKLKLLAVPFAPRADYHHEMLVVEAASDNEVY
jgi:hypothetical protein